MEHVLNDYGCNPVIGEMVEHVLNLLEEGDHTPDLIIADYRLRKGITGLYAIEQLRGRYGNNIPAIIVTGDTSPEWLQEATSAGCKVLFKPVKADKLNSVISEVLKP